MTATAERLSSAAARRIALAAQGFGAPLPVRPTARHLRAVISRLGLLQIDSVNVVARAHYLPPFSRLGSYDPALLDRDAWGRRRRLFEYWGHEASLLPCSSYPLLRWRMEDAARGVGVYGELARFARRRRALLERVLAEIRDRGPLAASEIEAGDRGAGGWWGWGDSKRALECLFWSGRVTAATRRAAGFERVYDVVERALPAAALAAPAPPRDDAQRALLMRAAAALGVATAADLRDYFRLPAADAKARLAELVEAGALRPVAVEGWNRPAFLHPAARQPRRIEAAALLAPFDPLVWERARTERLFGFRYRLEIYVPAHRRAHGYYALPFLLDEALVARVDVKADRVRRALVLRAAHAEPGRETAATADALARELARLAAWLGLERVDLEAGGAFAAAVGRSRPPGTA